MTSLTPSVAAAPVLGVFYSWSASALVLVGPITILLFRRLLPTHIKGTHGRHEPLSRKQVVGYAAPDLASISGARCRTAIEPKRAGRHCSHERAEYPFCGFHRRQYFLKRRCVPG